MAHFIVSAQGSRGAVSRLGGPNTGARAVVNEWDHGCRVVIRQDRDTGKDVVHVYRTTGSNARGSEVLVLTMVEGEAPELNPRVEYDDSARTEERY